MAKKVAVVTGAQGFIGSHLADYLLSLGYRVYGIARPGREVDLHRLQHLTGNKNFSTIQIDLANHEEVQKFMQSAKPSVVFHLASTTPFIGSAGTFYRRDTVGTTDALLDSMAKFREKPKMVYISTLGVYGSQSGVLHPKTHEPKPTDTYGKAKLLSEGRVLKAMREHGIPAVVVRPFVVVGARDKDKKPLPLLAENVERIKRGETVQPFKFNMDIENDYIDVRDAVRAIVRASEYSNGEIFHIASGRGTTMREIIRIYEKLSGVKIPHEHIESKKPRQRIGERNLPGWKPKHTMEDTVMSTMDYYAKRKSLYRTRRR